MRLIIYETTHHETLPAMLDLAVLCTESTLVFLDETTYRNLCLETSPENRWPGIQFIQRAETISHRNFIGQMFASAQQDSVSGNIHLHLGSLSNNYAFIAWKLMLTPQIQVSLTVHEINLYRSFSFHNFRGLTESAAKYYLHRRIRKFRVLIPRMKTELEKYFSQGEVVFIPSGFYTRSNTKSLNGPVKIIVPGTVESRRRDYDFLLHFVENHLKNSVFRQPVELILLGNAGSDYGKNILSRLIGSSSDHLKIVYFDHPVPAGEYARQMQEAKIIWSPIRVETTGSRGQKEIYGITKSSGLIADLLQFPKPSLVPRAFNIPYYFEQGMFGYQNENELMELIIRLSEETGSELLQKIENDISGLVAGNFRTVFENLVQPVQPLRKSARTERRD